MKKLSLLSIILFSIHNLKAQSNLDSLWNIWQDTTHADTARLNAIQDYIWDGYMFSQPDSAFYFAQLQYDFAKSKDLKNYIAFALNTLGVSYHARSNYTIALEYFQKSLVIREEIGDKESIPVLLSNIGSIYETLDNYPKALEYFQKSLVIFEEIGDKNRSAGSLTNIGTVYKNQGNYLLALEYVKKALLIDEEFGNNRGISIHLYNIGNIYSSLGNYPRALEYFQKSLVIFEEIGDKRSSAGSLANIGSIKVRQGNYSSALEYLQKSLTISEELGFKEAMITALQSIGKIYSKQGNYSSALEYLQKSLTISEELGKKSKTTASLLESIGNIYSKQGNYSSALEYCKSSLNLAEDIGALVQIKYACQCLYDSYKALGQNSQALLYLEKVKVLEDSLQTEETAKKLEQMEFAKIMLQDSIANAEEARRVEEAHREEVRKKNQTRNWSIAGGLLALLLAGGFYSRWRYVRKTKNIIEKERDRSDNLLLNILPADIAEELKENGRADARDFDMVSILFSDFKNFTQHSAQLSAAELVKEINVCFEAFDGIMEKYGIEKIKTIGDAYMAAGGLPVPSDDSVKSTVLAALDMQEFIMSRKAAQAALGEPAFEMRIGIHTGPVVAGIVGVKKFQYDIWGDAVNTASRMESNSMPGKVNISENTYNLLKNDPDLSFESRGKIQVKGKGELEMYFVDKSAA